MQYSGEFKQIDSLEKAYILGFLCADGTLTFNKKAIAYAVTLKLKKEDEYILDWIISLFPFFKKGKTEISKNGFKSEYIRKYSKELFYDLQNHGIFPRKSFENASKLFLPKLTKEQFFAYFHGILDGNGTIYQSKEGWIRIDLVGISTNLFNQIKNELEKYGVESNVYFRKNRNYWLLRISTKNSIKTIIENFKQTPFCLKRKFPPFFIADWDRVPDYNNRNKKYSVWFATTSKS